MITLILQGAGFGFAAGTTPGPLTSYLITTTLSYGWRRGLMVILSPLLSDIPIIVLMVFVLGALSDSALRVLQVAGGCYVLWLAWRTWKSSEAIRNDDALDIPISGRKMLMQAAGINFLSPGPYIFWGIITGPTLRTALNQSVWQGVAFVGAFYAAFLGLMLVWVILFDRLRRVDERITAGALRLSMGVLAVLGVVLIFQGLRG
jgi:threonine/homoserine/homoserine lactone efflux protein